jgi:hypothetical protein
MWLYREGEMPMVEDEVEIWDSLGQQMSAQALKRQGLKRATGPSPKSNSSRENSGKPHGHGVE